MPAFAPLLAASTLVLSVLLAFSQGKVYIDQVEFKDGERKSWPVDGVATVELGTGRDFAFDCGLIDEPADCLVLWAKSDGRPVSQQYTGIPQPVQLRFDESTPQSLGEYVCMVSDCSSNQSVYLIVTEANPAVLPVQQNRSITASIGDSVSIGFKISSLPEIEPTNIKWFHENSPIPATGRLSEDRRSLVLDNVQPSDAGHYHVEVCVSSQCEVEHTNLSIHELTTKSSSQIIMPTSSSSNIPLPSHYPSTSSNTMAKDTTPGLILSTGDHFPGVFSTLSLPSTTVVSLKSSSISEHPVVVTSQPDLQAQPTVSTTCFTTMVEESSGESTSTLVTAVVALLATILVATLVANALLLVCVCALHRRRKIPSSVESSYTKSSNVYLTCDSKNYAPHKEVNGLQNAAFGKNIIVNI